MKSFALFSVLVPLVAATATPSRIEDENLLIARNAKRTVSPVSFPYTFAGSLKVLDENGNGLAVVSNSLNNAGVFGITINGDRLKVKLTAESADKPFDIFMENGNSSFPYFAPVNGWYNSGSDLEVGNPNHLHLCGVTKTHAYDRPQSGMGTCTEEPENIESTIWYLNPRTGEVYPQWINADGSIPKQTLIYYADGPWGKNALVIAGDLAAFEREYGAFQKVYLTVGSRTDFPDTPGQSSNSNSNSHSTPNSSSSPGTSSSSSTIESLKGYISINTAVLFFASSVGLTGAFLYWRRRRAAKKARQDNYLQMVEEEMSLSQNDGNKFVVGRDD